MARAVVRAPRVSPSAQPADPAPPRAVVLFDGVCHLCNAGVQFIIANDPRAHFQFAALQSDAGIATLRAAGREPAAAASIVVIDAAGFHQHSDAVLRIAADLRAPWCLAAALRVIPAALRDRVYTWVARNRYRWFGRRTTCSVPPAASATRFL